MKTTLLKLLLLTFLACGALRPAAASSTYSWVGGSGTPINDWNTPANWILSAGTGNANFLPGPADIVDFSGAIANVWVDLATGPQTVSGLNFGPAPWFNLGAFAARTPALTLDAAGTINNAGGVAFIHTDLICGPSVGSATILLTGGPGQLDDDDHGWCAPTHHALSARGGVDGQPDGRLGRVEWRRSQWYRWLLRSRHGHLDVAAHHRHAARALRSLGGVGRQRGALLGRPQRQW